MNQKFRTTCYADQIAHYERSLEEDPRSKQETVGIRLVHETGMAEVRGRSSHSYTQFTGIHTMQRDKNLYGAMLGFRLVNGGGLDG